jgi:NifU-like N terminal domain
MCGDQLSVYLSLGSDGVIKDAAFEGNGCAISLASASLMTEILREGRRTTLSACRSPSRRSALLISRAKKQPRSRTCKRWSASGSCPAFVLFRPE